MLTPKWTLLVARRSHKCREDQIENRTVARGFYLNPSAFLLLSLSFLISCCTLYSFLFLLSCHVPRHRRISQSPGATRTLPPTLVHPNPLPRNRTIYDAGLGSGHSEHVTDDGLWRPEGVPREESSAHHGYQRTGEAAWLVCLV